MWCHITGTDLVRDTSGRFLVLEDNLRCPSGVSYVLANRRILKRAFPQVFEAINIRTVDDYPPLLLDMLQAIAPSRGDGRPTAALLTPGVFNSAYFEHTFLAQQAGIELVEGRDLVVMDGSVHMRTTKGLTRVDVIYRRWARIFSIPRSSARLRARRARHHGGLQGRQRGSGQRPGHGRSRRQGRLRLRAAHDPLLSGPGPHHRQRGDLPVLGGPQREHVLDNLETMVVKAAAESGGYGMLVGPSSTRKEREAFADKIKANPRNYIAQPTVGLSRCPVIVDDHFEGRHVDLRPYILYGEDIRVIPGGLTRVALRKGSLVVNSSQGGAARTPGSWAARPGKRGGEEDGIGWEEEKPPAAKGLRPLESPRRGALLGVVVGKCCS